MSDAMTLEGLKVRYKEGWVTVQENPQRGVTIVIDKNGFYEGRAALTVDEAKVLRRQLNQLIRRAERGLSLSPGADHG